MPWLISCGAALAVTGIVLVLLSGRGHRTPPLRPTWEDGSPAALRSLPALLDRMAALDTSLDRLGHAIDTLMPSVGRDLPPWGTPSHQDVVALCALVRHRLVALARHDLAGAPPSRSAARFAELAAAAIPPVTDPYAARLPAAHVPPAPAPEAGDAPTDPQPVAAGELDRPGPHIVAAALERYRTQRQRRDAAARQELVNWLVATGPALRAEYRRLQRPPGADVGEIAHALLGATARYLDALWTLCTPADRGIDVPVVARRDRPAFSRQLSAAATTLGTSDTFLRRGEHGLALRELATLVLPSAPGWPCSDDFVDACRRATGTLVTLADGRLADRVRMVEESAALVERHVELLVRHGLTAAHDRQQQHEAGFRWVATVAHSVDRATVDRAATVDVATADQAQAGGAKVDTVRTPVPRPRRPAAVVDVVAVAAG